MEDFYDNKLDELTGLIDKRIQEKSYSYQKEAVPSLSQPASPTNSLEQEKALIEMYTKIKQSGEKPTLITPVQLGALGNLKAGFKESVYSELYTLDLLSGWVADVTGLPKPGIFESLKGKVKPEDWELADKSFGATLLRSIGMVPIPLGEALLAVSGVGMLPVIGKAAVKVGAKQGIKYLAPQAAKAAIKEGAKGVIPLAAPLAFSGLGAGKAAIHGGSPLDIAEEAGKGAALGTGLGLLHPFGLPARVAGSGGLFGGMTAIEPEATREEVGAQTIVGGLLGLMGGRRKKPPGKEGPPKASDILTESEGLRGPVVEGDFMGFGPGPSETARARFLGYPREAEPYEHMGFGVPPEKTLKRPSPIETISAKASPEAQAEGTGTLVNFLASKGFRKDILESMDPEDLKLFVEVKRDRHGKVTYKTLDPEQLMIKKVTDESGETHKGIYKRDHKRKPTSSLKEGEIIDEIETVVSASRYNQLQTELKARVDKEVKGKVDTESLLRQIDTEGVLGGTTSTIRFNQAAQSIMSEFPNKKLTDLEFLKIVRDRYNIDPVDRERVAAVVIGEGWTIKGQGDTLEKLVGKKLEERLADRNRKTTLEERAKDADANQEPIPEEWVKQQDSQISKAVKDKMVPSKEAFDKLEIDEKMDVIDNIDHIKGLRGEMEALKLEGKLDLVGEKEYKKDIGVFKSVITKIFTLSKRFSKEAEAAEAAANANVEGPFSLGAKLSLPGITKKGIVVWSNAKETSIAIKEKGKDSIYKIIPNEQLTPLNKVKPVPPTGQDLELMPEDYPGIKGVAIKSGGKVYEAKAGETTHIQVLMNNGLEAEKSIPGYTKTNGEFVTQPGQGKIAPPAAKLGPEEFPVLAGDKEPIKAPIETAPPTSTIEAIKIGKTLTLDEAKLRWEEYKANLVKSRSGTHQEQMDKATKNQLLREEVETFLGAKDTESFTLKEIEKKFSTPKEKVLTPAIDKKQIAGEVEWMKANLTPTHGEEVVNNLIKIFEAKRNKGMDLDSAILEANKEAGIVITPIGGKTTKSRGALNKTALERIEKAKEEASKLKGVTPEKAKEIALENVSDEVMAWYTDLKGMVKEKYSDEFLRLSKQGLGLKEAAMKVKEMVDTDKEIATIKKRVVIRAQDGTERVVGAEVAKEVVEKAQSDAERVTQLAIDRGADPEISKRLMEGADVLPELETVTLPRPKGTADLPNPNEILLSAITQRSKVAEGVPRIKEALNKLRIKLDETARIAKILSAEKEKSVGDVEKLRVLDEKLAAQRGKRQNIVKDVDAYSNALEFLTQSIDASKPAWKVIKTIQEVDMGLTVVMESKPGASRFLAIQDERGMAGSPRSGNKYSGTIEVIEGKNEVIAKVINLAEGVDPRVGYQLLDAVQEHYILEKIPKITGFGKPKERGSFSNFPIPISKRVVREQGVGDQIWDMKQDKDQSRIIAENHITPEDIAKISTFSQGMTESLIGKIVSSFSRGTENEQLNRRAIKAAIESIKSDIDPFQLVKPGEVRKSPSVKDYVPVSDILADPSQSTVPVIKWVGEQRVRAELNIRDSIQGWRQLSERWFGFIIKDPELNRKMVKYLHGLDSNPTPQMVEIGKQVRIFMDGLAAQTELAEKGLYRSNYFPLIIDKNVSWNDYFAKPLRTTRSYEELPAKVQGRIPADIWDRAKKLADTKKDFDSFTKGDKDFIENNVFPWAGIHTDYMTAPDWVRNLLPKEVFVKFFQPRKSHMEAFAKENFWDTLQTYINVAVAGKVNNDFLTAVRPVINQLEFANKRGTIRHYLDSYVRKTVLHDVGTLDSAWNAVVEHINTNILNKDVLPLFAPKKLSVALARALYRGTISIDTALKNTTQTLYSWAKSGNAPVLSGLIDFLGDVGKAGLKAGGIGKGAGQRFQDFKRFHSVIDEFFNADLEVIKKANPSLYNKIQSAGKLATDFILSPMRFAEFLNRGVAYYAGLEEALKMGLDNTVAHYIGVAKAGKARSNPGFTENQMLATNKLLESKYGSAPSERTLSPELKATEAQWSALAGTSTSQFGYTSAHTSPYMMGTGVGFFKPFTSFPIKTFQFVANGLKDSWLSGDQARLIRFTVLTGFMATAPVMVTELFGVDTSQLWGKGILPFNFVPAWAKLIGDAYTSVGGGSYLDKKMARQRTAENMKLYSIPQYRYGKKIVKSLEDLNRGYETWGPGQHPLREFTEADLLMKLIGFPPSSAREARELMHDVSNEKLRVFDKRTYINRILDLKEKGTESADKEIVKLFEKSKKEGLPISPLDIIGAKKMREIDIYTFNLTKGQKRLRTGVWGEALKASRESHLPTKFGTKPMWSSPGFAESEEGGEID